MLHSGRDEQGCVRSGDARRAHELLISAYTQLPTPTAFTLSDELAPDLNTADTSEVAALPVPQVAPELAQLQRQLLIELLESAQRIEEIDQAQSYAEKLAELSEEPTDKSRFLRQAAECALRGGHFQIGKDLLLKGLRYTPGNLDLLSRLAPLFDDSETVALLGVMLEQAVPTEGEAATSQARAQRIELWRHLANAQLRLEEREAAAHSYDQAIAVAQSLGRDSALELELRRAADGYRLLIVNTGPTPAPAFTVSLRAGNVPAAPAAAAAQLSAPGGLTMAAPVTGGKSPGAVTLTVPPGIETVALLTLCWMGS